MNYEPPNYDRIYQLGHAAGKSGMAESNCPYTALEDCRRVWLEGWKVARIEVQESEAVA